MLLLGWLPFRFGVIEECKADVVEVIDADEGGGPKSHG